MPSSMLLSDINANKTTKEARVKQVNHWHVKAQHFQLSEIVTHKLTANRNHLAKPKKQGSNKSAIFAILEVLTYVKTTCNCHT